MISLNPFKKKHDDGFSLDEHQLPSLSQSGGPQQPQTEESIPEPPQSQENQQSTQPLPEQQPFSQGNGASFSNPFAQQPSQMQPQDLSASSDMTPSSQQPQQHNEDATKYHNDYSKAKLESIDAKVALLDAKMSSLEQKVDALLSMVSAEVSEETKSKLKLNSMLDSIRKNDK